MNGIPAIVAEVRKTLEHGGAGVLATVVRVRGSAYRRPGARMFLPDEGDPVGLVSGGCLEADLAERAREVTESGRPTHVLYDMRSPDDIVWGLGLGCDGEIRVLLERIGPGPLPAELASIARHAERREHFALATCYESDDAHHDVGARFSMEADLAAESACPTDLAAGLATALQSSAGRDFELETHGGRSRWCVEQLTPPIRLWIFGAGLDAQPVATLAVSLGWNVRLFDPRAPTTRTSRFPAAATVEPIDPAHWRPDSCDANTAALLMTHHFLHDLALLDILLPLPLPYVGVLGPKKRCRNLLDRMSRRSGRADADPSQLFGPVGLNIGAETPEEIALSAIAEIQAVLAGRRAGFLKDRDAPLH